MQSFFKASTVIVEPIFIIKLKDVNIPRIDDCIYIYSYYNIAM